eukprot:m.419676 g.419676  ORF g.419676 m.419676 type:complete len:77 (-) comp21306_c0_seq8:2323-2553(-)
MPTDVNVGECHTAACKCVQAARAKRALGSMLTGWQLPTTASAKRVRSSSALAEALLCLLSSVHYAQISVPSTYSHC